MKKFTKRIAAMGAAVMMAVSLMSVSASAGSFNLHYTYSAPTSDNVIYSGFSYHVVDKAGKYKVITNLTTYTAVSVKTFGYVKYNGTYYHTTSLTQNSTGSDEKTESDSRIKKGATARNQVHIVYTGLTSARATGTTSGY